MLGRRCDVLEPVFRRLARQTGGAAGGDASRAVRASGALMGRGGEEETECGFDSGVRRSRGHCSGIASGASSPTIQPTHIIFDIVQIRSPPRFN